MSLSVFFSLYQKEHWLSKFERMTPKRKHCKLNVVPRFKINAKTPFQLIPSALEISCCPLNVYHFKSERMSWISGQGQVSMPSPTQLQSIVLRGRFWKLSRKLNAHIIDICPSKQLGTKRKRKTLEGWVAEALWSLLV